jgi:hypothetical protein
VFKSFDAKNFLITSLERAFDFERSLGNKGVAWIKNIE